MMLQSCKPWLHEQFFARAGDAIFQILSRRQRERVATRVTNSSEFGDKLKAAQIAYFKTPGHYKQTWQTAIWTRILFYPLFAFFLTIKIKRRKKKKKKKRSTWVRLWLTGRKERGFYHQLVTEISLAKYSLVESQARAKSGYL